MDLYPEFNSFILSFWGNNKNIESKNALLQGLPAASKYLRPDKSRCKESINLCDLTKLNYISEKEAELNGFACQYVYYLRMLQIYDTSEEINGRITKDKDVVRNHLYNDSLSVQLAKLDKMSVKKFFINTSKNLEEAINGYDNIKSIYPQFNDFMVSMSKKEISDVSFADCWEQAALKRE